MTTPLATPARRTHWNRFEYKYLIDEPTAAQVRRFARAYLEPDEFAQPKMAYQYPIHSVYLDGPGLPLYRATTDGHKNRFKLRVRYYTDNPAHPVFFEIKRRVFDVIIKERALVHRDRALLLLRGRAPAIDDLVNPDSAEQWHALREFINLRDVARATPRVIVSYLREAYVKPGDDHVRLTFDRALAGSRYRGRLVPGDEFQCPPIQPGAPVVLELKFTERFPTWYRDLCQSLDLRRASMAKYCQVTQLAGPGPVPLRS